MVEALSTRRDSLRRGGFTLIEVVVALAIFVFGAVAIIRIFPSALGVIQNSGDRLVAININRSREALYVREPNLVPDAVFDDQAQMPLYAQTWRDNLVGSIAGSPRRNNSIPRGNISGGGDSSGFSTDLETSYEASALGHSKNIAGEKHLIDNNGDILTQFRFDSTISPSVFREDTVSGVTYNTATNKLDFSTATKDSDGTAYDPITIPLMPAVNPALQDSLYVSYQYISGSRVWATEDEPIRIRIGGSLTIPTYSVSHPTPVPGSFKMRIRQPITAATTNTSDGKFGFLDLNGAKDASGTLVGTGIPVSIDYRVEDWRWLTYDEVPTITSEDLDPPPSATQNLKTVQLPIRSLDDNSPGSDYVYAFFPSATPASSFQSSTTANPTTGPLYAINAKRGRVIFDVNQSATTPAVPKARVIYRTSDNWANQLSVAARSYLLSLSGPSLEPWRDYGFDNNNTEHNFLYFKPNEAGKTLRVSYSYIDSGGVERKLDGRVVTIDNTLLDDTGMNLPSGLAIGGRVARLELTGINGEELDNNMPKTPVVAIRETKGVSIQSRTAWLDGNAFNQTSSVAFRQGNN